MRPAPTSILPSLYGRRAHAPRVQQAYLYHKARLHARSEPFGSHRNYKSTHTSESRRELSSSVRA